MRAGGEKLPSSSLALHMTTIWEVVRANKDLNLPAHRVMVANIRCEQIAADQVAALQAASQWQSVCSDVGEGVVEGFGGVLGELLKGCLAGGAVGTRPLTHGGACPLTPSAPLMLCSIALHVMLWCTGRCCTRIAEVFTHLMYLLVCSSVNPHPAVLTPTTAYDEEARYFDSGVSSSKREELEQQLQALATPLWQQQVAHINRQGLEDVEEALKGATGPFAAAAASCVGDRLLFDASQSCACGIWGVCMGHGCMDAPRGQRIEMCLASPQQP